MENMETFQENSRGKCPQCGKKVKFLKKHIKRMHSEGKIPEKVQKISRENSSFLNEINLMEEYEKMAEKVDLKKDAEPKYECPACGEKFNDKKKFCPGCGAEFA